MHKYILQRLVLAIPVMLLVALFAFGVMRHTGVGPENL